jgi:hypothetical protein
VTAVASRASGATEFYEELSQTGEFTDEKLSTIEIDESGYNFTIHISLGTGSDDNE